MVTGAAGFVGSHLLRHLLAATDWELICPVRTKSRRMVDDPRVRWLDCDLTHGIPTVHSHLILNLAAVADPVKVARAPSAFTIRNTEIMLNVCEYARWADARVLQLSTNEVYGAASAGAAEGTPLQPNGPYGGAKACQEMAAMGMGIPLTIVNTQNLFGERQQPEKLLPTVIRHLSRGEAVELQGAQSHGTWIAAARPWLHAQRLSERLLGIATTAEFATPRHHVVGPLISNHLLVDYVAEALNVQPCVVKWVPTGDRPGHELVNAMCGSEAATYGEFLEDLRRTVHWYCDTPGWL